MKSSWAFNVSLASFSSVECKNWFQRQLQRKKSVKQITHYSEIKQPKATHPKTTLISEINTAVILPKVCFSTYLKKKKKLSQSHKDQKGIDYPKWNTEKDKYLLSCTQMNKYLLNISYCSISKSQLSITETKSKLTRDVYIIHFGSCY